MSLEDVKLSIEVVADDLLHAHGRLLVVCRQADSDSVADVDAPHLASELIILNATKSLATINGPLYSQVQRAWLSHTNASTSSDSPSQAMKRHLLIARMQFAPPLGVNRISWEVSDARTCTSLQPKVGQCALLWQGQSARGSEQTVHLALSLFWITVKAAAIDTGQLGPAPGLQTELHMISNGSSPFLLSSAGIVPFSV
jgi:hypothetical protein